MEADSTVRRDSQLDHATAIDVDPAILQAEVPAEAPHGRSREPETDRPENAPGTTVGASQPGRRALKLVLTLTPIETAGYRGILAVGTDDCDPLLQSVEVADLPAALQAATSLVVAAAERWQSQPRNPASVKKAGGASAKGARARQQSSDEPSQEPGTRALNSESAQPGQLPLFG